MGRNCRCRAADHCRRARKRSPESWERSVACATVIVHGCGRDNPALRRRSSPPVRLLRGIQLCRSDRESAVPCRVSHPAGCRVDGLAACPPTGFSRRRHRRQQPVRPPGRARLRRGYFAASGKAGNFPTSRASCWMMSVAFRFAASCLMRSMEANVCARSKLKAGTPAPS